MLKSVMQYRSKIYNGKINFRVQWQWMAPAAATPFTLTSDSDIS